MGDDLWSAFSLDPRERAHADLRASDQDRDRITGVLSSAFADGRLEREELEERMSVTSAARTLRRAGAPAVLPFAVALRG